MKLGFEIHAHATTSMPKSNFIGEAGIIALESADVRFHRIEYTITGNY